jgi:hypothetical protein
MRLKLLRCWTAGAGLAVAFAASAVAPKVERFLGTGRACYGALTITPKTLSWITPFSRCDPVSFQIVEQDPGRTTFRMAETMSECRYQVLSLTHQHPDDPDKGWHVTGYRDESSYREHKATSFSSNQSRTLSCYLIRDPDPASPLDW